jgi:peroxiredoxin
VRRLLVAVISGAAVLAASRLAECAVPAKPAIGDVVQNFAAKDAHGADFSLSQVDADKIVVFAFLGVDCPLAKLYTPRLSELAQGYQAKGVVFVAVDANRQDSVTAMAAYARRNGLPFPFLKDLRQAIANRLGATRTPQVVVLDRQRKIRYRGRIDDQFGFMPKNPVASYHRTKAERTELERALDELLAGNQVSISETDAVGCLIGRDRQPVANSPVTYAKDVAPILNRRCVACHRPKQIAPFSLTSYEEAVGWADMIAEVTQLGRMPPWHADPEFGSFQNDARLSDTEKAILVEWAAAGAPAGDLKDWAPPPKFVEGWSIPQPDEVIYMSDRPHDVPATGVIPYQDFIVDPGWKEDRFISAIEPRPGNPAVVHHILVFVIPPEGRKEFLREDDSYLAVFSPGLQPNVLPAGLARPVRAGSRLLFDIHYTPNGSPQQDRSFLGIKFADPRSVKREVTVSGAINKTFQIPPGASNYEVKSRYVFRDDCLMLSLFPHAHYRGNDFLFFAHYPDGGTETLVSVPHYDFGWQTVYRFDEPKLMPRGTVIEVIAHFDNSEANLNNPDPNAAVTWGEQTFEEMMIGLFEIAPAAEGLVYHTPWWKPILARISIVRRISVEQAAAVGLTLVNVLLLGTLIFRFVRSRRRRATVQSANPVSAYGELVRGDSSQSGT